MTISEAIAKIKSIKPNDFDSEELVGWLSTLDFMIFEQIMQRYEDCEVDSFDGYSDDALDTTQLLVAAPYADDLYINYLASKIDLCNREYGSYNNMVALFNTAYENYRSNYNRTHTHKQTTPKYF